MNFINITGTSPIAHFLLKDNPSGAFRELGLSDQNLYKDSLTELTNLLKLDFMGVDFVIDKLIRRMAYKSSKRLIYQEYFENYLDGLKISKIDLLTAYMVPEVITALRKFMPKLPLGFLSCSTLMAYDLKKDSSIHGRVLDFPIVKNYLKSERGIIYDFKGHPKIWSLGIAGLPFASLTGMNSEGVSLALHMKYGDHFNSKNGYFIFEIAFKILMECRTKEDVLKVLKSFPSISSWGLYLTFKDGTGMSIDLFGGDFRHNIVNLKEGSQKLTYQNNFPIDESLDQLGTTVGLDHYCSMRQKSANHKIEKFLSQNQGSSITSNDVLTILGRPQTQKSDDALNWKQDTTTITSVHTVAMSPTLGEVQIIPGDVPKILEDQILVLKNVFQEDIKKISTDLLQTNLKELDLKFITGFRLLSKAENSYEQKELPKAYHYIQLAIDNLKGYPEEIIANFYFLMLKMIHLNSKEDLTNVLKEFRVIEKKLPYYINDHAILAIARLERILHGKTLIKESSIKTDDLKKIFSFEQKIPPLILKKMRSFISLQFGTVDVIYTYPI